MALTEDDRQKGNFVRIDESNLPYNTPVHGFLNDYHDEVLLLRRVFTNKDDSTGVLYLVCSDLQCDKDKFINGYQKRWQVEVYHMFLATYAVFKLECLKIKTKLNHFALRTKLLISANQSAFAQLKAISGA